MILHPNRGPAPGCEPQALLANFETILALLPPPLALFANSEYAPLALPVLKLSIVASIATSEGHKCGAA